MFKAAPDIQLALSTYPSTKEAVTIIDEDDATCGIVKLDDLNIWTSEIEGITITGANVDPDNPPQEPAEFEVGLWMPCGLEVEPFPLPGMMHFEWYTPIDEDHHAYMICCAKEVHSAEEEAEFHKVCEEIAGPMVWRGPDNQTEPVGDGMDWGFNNFDAFGREQIHHAYQYEDYWHKEHLFRPDYIIVRWRMLVAKRMRGIQKRGEWAHTHGWSPDGRDLRPAETQLTRLPGTSL